MDLVTLLPTATRHRCGHRVRWCRTPLGGPVCIDAEPQTDGTVVMILTADGWVAEGRRGYRAIALRQAGTELYRYHHCEL